MPAEGRQPPSRASSDATIRPVPLSSLPVKPIVEPMLAELIRELPEGEGWLYEPKWDGFRALVFWDGTDLLIQSRDLKPLGRYFPELEAGLKQALPRACVLDGEVVVLGKDAPRSGLDFDALQQRIHPAASRIELLARETPAEFVAFDLLAVGADELASRPLAERRAALETLLADAKAPVRLTPATTDRVLAADWFERFEGAGLDGVVAKRLDLPYRPGQRVMLKVKHQRTVDCVVSGFRWHKNGQGTAIGSLLLGLYDDSGVLHHVGATSTFKLAERKRLVAFLEPYRGESGFGRGRTPGEPNRWTGTRDVSWEPLRPELVCEVAFDHLQGDRFRHGATFLRWRSDKPPAQCTYSQIAEVPPLELQEVFAGR
jgi:ATP-dependent DNA ligase